MNYFIWSNISSLDMGIRIQSKNVFSAPKRDISFKSVGGRNGDLILSNNRYENIDVSYTVFIASKSIGELTEKITKIKQWLYSKSDRYSRLDDSYDKKFYRQAVFHKSLDIEDQLNKIGVFTINFNCKPFRYDVVGDEEISVTTSTTTIVNPYVFSSSPYIKITAGGDVSLKIQHESNTSIWNISNIDGYIEIDSELMYFHKGSENKNSTVIGDGFPKFLNGENIITLEGDFTEMKIIPRWVYL